MDRNLVQGWRGRRLMSCQAAETLRLVVDNLDADNGADIRSQAAPAVTPEAKAELTNLINVVLRMTLLLNDGSVSPQRLPPF